MENKFQLIGAGVSLAIGISILACGGGLGGGVTTCTTDIDCTGAQVCNTDVNECQDTCTDDQDCFEGDSCLPRPGNSFGNTCQFDPNSNTDPNTNPNTNPNTTAAECTENEQCINGDNIEGICFDGVCEYPEETTTYRWIVIKDESSSDEACNTTDPGSDIMGVRLLDASGQVVGWGTAGGDQLGTVGGGKENAYPTTSSIDGQPNDVLEQECSEGRLADVEPFSTGCGGWVLVEFVDNGTPVDIEDNFIIEVLEYGLECNSPSNEDAYSVYLCEDAASAQGGSDATCNLAVGGQQRGIGSVTVSL